MRRILASVFALLAAGSAGTLRAQQPVAAKPLPLDAIVAVVGDQPITRYDLTEARLAKIQRREVKEPADSAALAVLDSTVLDDMVQDELIQQKAKDLKIEVTDAEITPDVDRQVKDTRSQFPNESEFTTALAKASLGTPAEYRRFLMDQYRRQMTRQKVLRKLTQDAKIIPINVTDAEVAAEFEKSKEFLPKKPASVTFKQIVIAPAPTQASKEVARVRAESLLAELKRGGDFERIAKRESMDPLTKETGGDLGWARRGSNLPEFERWLFGAGFQAALSPGQMSPVVETPYGYHIIRVDRVQPGEVKARQILIVPKIDSADILRTQKLADSVADRWKAGASFDTLAKKFHDFPGKEETSILTPFPRDTLPIPYQKAFILHKPMDIVTFQIPGAAAHPEIPKFVVAQLLTVDEGGDRTLGELKSAVRSELAQRGGIRRYIDGLKRQTYVAIRLKTVEADPTKVVP
ncbi:MAG: peptidylprolyl isomerase [bacterium]